MNSTNPFEQLPKSEERVQIKYVDSEGGIALEVYYLDEQIKWGVIFGGATAEQFELMELYDSIRDYVKAQLNSNTPTLANGAHTLHMNLSGNAIMGLTSVISPEIPVPENYAFIAQGNKEYRLTLEELFEKL